MLKAKDIMTEVVVSVRPDMPVKKAMKLLLASEIAGTPVVEKDMTLVGIVTEKDLLELFKEPQRADGATVAEFMTQPAVHFEEDESLDDICKCLLDVAFRRVPVTKDGKVVGIVSRPDVLRYILEQLAQKVNP
jgi:CBS domain-containing membrane protein